LTIGTIAMRPHFSSSFIQPLLQDLHTVLILIVVMLPWYSLVSVSVGVS
jgi:hypothetical protein